jgi:hypothetical protein
MRNSTKRLLLLMLIAISANTLHAQNSYHGDDKFLHFGFSLGMNTMDFGITPSLQTIDGKIYQVDVSTLKPGFSVGIVSDMMLSRYLNLRFTPTLHFGERELSYNPTLEPIVVPSVPITIPLYVKLSSERYGNLRPYLIGGGGAYIDLGRDNENPLMLKPLDLFIEFGVGCDIYFSFFKLAPELKFAFGYNNMLMPIDQRDTGFLNPADHVYTNALSKLTSRFVTLTFNFE